jgi:NTP pyrophosphatase (non-canonical NTP hydrolase)
MAEVAETCYICPACPSGTVVKGICNFCGWVSSNSNIGMLVPGKPGTSVRVDTMSKAAFIDTMNAVNNAAAAANKNSSLREANIVRNQEYWPEGSPSLSFRGVELAGEAGEACNLIKKLERERMGKVGTRATIEELAEELADVVICADLIAMDQGIDLEAAIREKFNKTSEKYNLKTKM